MPHAVGKLPGANGRGKHGWVLFVTISKNPRIACEQGLNGGEKFSSRARNPEVILIPPGLLPKLFRLWNTHDPDGERGFWRFVHTMKKKIL